MTLGNLVFDQCYLPRAIARVHQTLPTCDDKSSRPPPLTNRAARCLAMTASLLSVALTAKGASENARRCVDLAVQTSTWRLGRLLSDIFNQGLGTRLPSLQILDEKGQALVGDTKHGFEKAVLTGRVVTYAVLVFVTAFVLRPMVESLLGGDDQSDLASDRLHAHAAGALTSALVEAIDEIIALAMQGALAAQRRFTVAPKGGGVPDDWLEKAENNGSMRALFGVSVTEVAQLILSADRSHAAARLAGNAVGALSISVMELRGKIAALGEKLLTRAEQAEAQKLLDELTDIVEHGAQDKPFATDQAKSGPAGDHDEERTVFHTPAKPQHGAGLDSPPTGTGQHIVNDGPGESVVVTPSKQVAPLHSPRERAEALLSGQAQAILKIMGSPDIEASRQMDLQIERVGDDIERVRCSTIRAVAGFEQYAVASSSSDDKASAQSGRFVYEFPADLLSRAE